MWYFLVIFNTKIIESTKIMITIITPIIVVIIVTWFCNMRKNIVFDVQKKLYNLPELKVIRAMPKRKHFFFREGFPGKLYNFFGRQKRRFNAYYRTK